MTENPYLTQGPALIGFSGGGTSGYLLAQILAAHGGRLPPDVRVVCTNTGREHPSTLRFVHEVQTRWNVDIHWIEWRATPAQVENRTGFREWLEKHDPDGQMVDPAGFATVGFNSASRNGEPFAALIAMKRTTPNGRRPFCTTDLKIEPALALARSWGWEKGQYVEPIGLRADERPGRLAKAKADAVKFGRKTDYPLAAMDVTKNTIKAFWREQDFRLDLPPGHGNCDLCFKKGREIRKRANRHGRGPLPGDDADLITASSTPAPAATPGVPDSVRALIRVLDEAEKRKPSAGTPEDVVRLLLDNAREDAKSAALSWVRALIAAQPAGQAGDAGAGPRRMAEGCCSAVSPCSHQRRDPYSLCAICQKANGLTDKIQAGAPTAPARGRRRWR